MFSVIIPVYNGAEFIDKAIKCVYEQSFPEWELIIINDGSEDNTEEVLEAYRGDAGIKIINQENQGVSAARNKGIEAATYPYLVFLDADDLWRENHLEVLAEMIKAYPDAGMYCTFTETETLDGKVIKTCKYFEDKPETVYLEDFFEAYAQDKSAKMYTVISTCATKEAAERAGGFTVGCKIGEDLEFSLKISAYYPVVLTSRATAVYQRANSTATRNTSFDPEWNFFDEVNKLYADPSITESKKKNIYKVMQWFNIRRSRHYMIEGEKKKAVAVLERLGHTDLKKDLLMTKILLLLPTRLVRRIFLMRWRTRA